MAATDVSREARLVPPGAEGLEAQTCDAMVVEEEAQFCAARASPLLESVKFPEAQFPGSATALSYEATASPAIVLGGPCALRPNLEGRPAAVLRPSGDVIPVNRVYSRRRPCPDSPATKAQKAFIDKLSKNTEGLIPQPPAVPKRRSRAPPPTSVPRRSRRTAGLEAELPGILDAGSRKTVMRSLGIELEREHVNQKIMDDYAKLFSGPLSASHVQALAVLFGWSPPEGYKCRGVLMSTS